MAVLDEGVCGPAAARDEFAVVAELSEGVVAGAMHAVAAAPVDVDRVASAGCSEPGPRRGAGAMTAEGTAHSDGDDAALVDSGAAACESIEG